MAIGEAVQSTPRTLPVFSILLSLCVVNAQSLRNKVCDFHDLLLERNLDFLLVSESWLKPSDPDYVLRVGELCPTGYTYIDTPRPTKKSGGGVAVIYRATYDVKILKPIRKVSSFESMCIQVNSEVVILVVYRVPGRQNINNFLNDLDDMLSQLMVQYKSVVVCGDFNIHFENGDDSLPKSVLTMMSDYGFMDHICGRQTHRRGGSIDALFSCGLKSEGMATIEDLSLSDHFVLFSQVYLDSHVPRSSNVKAFRRVYEYRNYDQLDTQLFDDYIIPELSKLTAFSVKSDSGNEVACRLDQLLSDSLDKFAPKTLRKTSKPKSKYDYDPEIAQAKQYRRGLERKYLKDRHEIDRQNLLAQRKVVRQLVNNRKSQFYQNKILSSSNPKQLFKTVQDLTTSRYDNILPTTEDDQQLSCLFSGAFTSKVGKIVQKFANHTAPDVESRSCNVLSGFRYIDVEEVSDLRKIKCSALDFLPTKVFSRLWPYICPIVTNIVNLSMSSGIFPDVLKMAHIKPLLKSPTLDTEDLLSYRPVSNLSFVSKVVETAMNSQLQQHFTENNLMCTYQSAYRKGHSVESALTHVYSSILKELDRGRSVFLVMLDLSAAFDTISHERLLHVLDRRFGLRSKALHLIQSYLSNRVSAVKVRGTLSTPIQTNVGVPQGSILGPVLFNCIMAQLPSLLSNFGIQSHIYADDTQFWVSFLPENEEIARRHVQRAFTIITKFMLDNSLQLNPNKTQFLPISRSIELFEPLDLGNGITIPPSCHVKNLGVIFDTKLSFLNHASEIRRSGFFHLRRVKALGGIIPSNCLEILIHAYVTSRIDFCNILLHDHNQYLVNRFQTLHNACAKAITGARKYDSASVQLATLHWLPVKQRSQYKALIYCHKIAHSDDNFPAYFSGVFNKKKQRSTRLGGVLLDSNYRPKLRTVGFRSFDSYAPHLWNSLPQSLRDIPKLGSFKKQLKTFLFSQAFT